MLRVLTWVGRRSALPDTAIPFVPFSTSQVIRRASRVRNTRRIRAQECDIWPTGKCHHVDGLLRENEMQMIASFLVKAGAPSRLAAGRASAVADD